MESDSCGNSRLLTAGGVLSIIGGALQITGGGIEVARIMPNVTLGPLVPFLPVPFLPGREIWIVCVQNSSINMAILVMILGAVAIIGGVTALRRKHYGLSFAGAICALPSLILGIPAVIFVSMRKIEFGVETKEEASYGSKKRRLLVAGGILSVVAGISQMICGAVLIVNFLTYYPKYWALIDMFFLPFLPWAWRHYVLWEFLWGSTVFGVHVGVLIWWAIAGGYIGVIGILAITGGVSAIRKKRFDLSLVGAVCALPSTIFGVLAVVFVALGKREFRSDI